MLRSISIQNYALINKIDIHFNEGFSVITGETGSGKSIILGALSLILGQRPETNMLKNKQQKCVVEATFNIMPYNLKKFFQKHDLEYEDQTLVRREIQPDGKTRAFINDSPVNLRILKELGEQLVDIHSQNQNLTLGNHEFQLRIIDTFAKNQKLLNSYQENYQTYSKLKNQLQDLKNKTEKAKADADYLQYQLNQLNQANIKPNEQENLEQELKTLNNSEEIKTNLLKASEILQSENTSVTSQTKEAVAALKQIMQSYPEIENLHNRLESAYIEIQDLANELERKNQSVEIDPARINFLNERLDTIYSLQQKHKVASVEELLQTKIEIEQKLQQLSSSDEEIDSLQNKLTLQENTLSDIAQQLSNSRTNVFNQIQNTIINKLQNLGIPNVNFKIAHNKTDDFNPTGNDIITFLFSANKNGELQEIPAVASGGELSRLMLSIKHLISASTALPSIIFDEIDSGVSGEIADKMGTMLQKMAENIQIISITHLPQIAGKGKHHYKVYKADDELETYSNIVLLDQKQRVEELAKMLSGSDVTYAAFQNAKTLLNN